MEIPKNTCVEEMTPYKDGFMAGMLQLRQCDVNACRNDLIRVLGVRNPLSFRRYRDGVTEPKVTKIFAIEAVFAKYGVTCNIWGKGDQL